MKNQAVKSPLSLVEKPKRDRKPREKKEKTWRERWINVKNARGVGGAVFGSSASGIAYLTMHQSLSPAIMSGKGFCLETTAYSVILIGCLLFSFPTAYEYFMRAFRDKGKACGLVVLFELTLLSSNIHWLSIFAAGLLMLVNGVSAATNSMARYEDPRYKDL